MEGAVRAVLLSLNLERLPGTHTHTRVHTHAQAYISREGGREGEPLRSAFDDLEIAGDHLLDILRAPVRQEFLQALCVRAYVCT